MAWYFAKLALLLPILALLIWGSLRLTRMAQDRLGTRHKGTRVARLVETAVLGPGMRLAVIEFRGREILIGCTKQGLTRLSEVPLQDRLSAEP